MSLLLLGPTNWVPGHNPHIPGWVVEILPPGRSTQGTPTPNARDVRAGLVARLRLANVKATMMELHEDLPTESPADKLVRVIAEDKVAQYAVFWPRGGERSGLDVEIGWLLKAIHSKEIDARNIGVFYEWHPGSPSAADIVIRKNGTAVFESPEEHRRTTYYSSLVAWGTIPIPWSSYEDLLEFLEEFGRTPGP